MNNQVIVVIVIIAMCILVILAVNYYVKAGKTLDKVIRHKNPYYYITLYMDENKQLWIDKANIDQSTSCLKYYDGICVKIDPLTMSGTVHIYRYGDGDED